MSRPWSFAVLLAGSLMLPVAGRAAESLEADYRVELRGIPVGSAKLRVESYGNRYSVRASGRTSALVRIVSDAEASGKSTGIISDNRLVPANYEQRWTEDGEEEVVGVRFRDAAVADISIEPAPKPGRKIVPVTAKDKQEVLDPLSALVFPGDVTDGPALCDRTLPVFDGRQRYDLTLSFSRTEPAAGKDSDAHPGGVVVCSIRYHALAGHRPGRSSVRFMEANKDMEVWLGQIAGSGLVAPTKIRVRIRAGVLNIEARRFSTTASAAAGGTAAN